MTAKELKTNFLEAKKAKTKFDMCYYMDMFHWKNIPWKNLMCNLYSKSELKMEYNYFFSTFNL